MIEEIRKNSKQVTVSIIIIGVMVSLLWVQGRVWWCKQGDYSPWSSEIFGSHNSQHFFDPYSFTHVLHGVLFFWIISFIFKKTPFAWQLVLSILIEAVWEVVENSTFIIERYRAATISLDYFGDSIINSFSDVLCCAFGAWIAYKLKFWRSLAFFLITEILLIIFIRDSLLINILMLVYPLEAIKTWQNG